jgi:hypothetical protein
MMRVFENRQLILRSKMEQVMQDYEILHNKELKYLYPSSNVISTIKLKSMRRTGHMVRRGRK